MFVYRKRGELRQRCLLKGVGLCIETCVAWVCYAKLLYDVLCCVWFALDAECAGETKGGTEERFQ